MGRKYWQGSGEVGTLVLPHKLSKYGSVMVGNILEVPQKDSIEILFWYQNSTLRYIIKRIQADTEEHVHVYL